mmetsp:Transcript_24113/g.71022  ORF Transcript_24113/g.71022 Transcript_24113/m.71022 type:complete len:306 (+) Transcript_24113:228-1145(+)
MQGHTAHPAPRRSMRLPTGDSAARRRPRPRHPSLRLSIGHEGLGTASSGQLHIPSPHAAVVASAMMPIVLPISQSLVAVFMRRALRVIDHLGRLAALRCGRHVLHASDGSCLRGGHHAPVNHLTWPQLEFVIDACEVHGDAVHEHEEHRRHRQGDGPRELHPCKEKRREVEEHHSDDKEEKAHAVFDHHAIYGGVHAAVRPAQSQAGTKHRAHCGVEEGNELDRHRSCSDREIGGLHRVRRAVRNVHLNDAGVRKAAQEGCLRADRYAISRVKVKFLLADLDQAHLQVVFKRLLVREEHGASLGI